MRNPTSTRLISFFLVLLSLAISATNTNAQVCEADDGKVCAAVDNNDTDELVKSDELEESLQSLIDWIRGKGGYIHPSLSVGYSLLHNNELGRPTYRFGVFVKDGEEKISEGEKLMSIPSETIIQVAREAEAEDVGEVLCLLADQLAFERHYNRIKEQTDGDDDDYDTPAGSSFEPYIKFLENYVVDHSNIPATWSAMGVATLRELFSRDPHFFPTFREFYRCFHFDVFGEGNDDRHSNDPMMNDVEYWDEVIEIAHAHGLPYNKLVPIFDLIQHSSDPQKINVEVTSASIVVDLKDNWEVVASRDLAPKEELRFSYYTDYKYGGDNAMTKHSKDMFMNHGIVEDYPQQWTWEAHALTVGLDRRDTAVNDDDDDDTELALTWLGGDLPDDDTMYYLQTELSIWKQYYNVVASMETEATTSGEKKAENEEQEEDDDLILSFEKELLLKYIDAHMTALEMTIAAAMADRQSLNETEYQVQEEKFVINNVDSIYFNQYQCNTLIQRVFDHDFDTIEHFRSAYQQINYYRDPETDDVCLYLDGVYQQCVSYWPHYHELVVHKPAKYLKEDLKRILWVGGGDSGPLNEFLKYPTVDLVVGLELDQQVTRSAFKHFASRPHFDNPKVQWWYGDASKSLLMLPEDYFGSFDLVVVDLSDTVFSLSVSAELDVIEAISLLLRPGGIFEMNELFMKKVSNVFEHAIHYQFSDVPKICDQAAIFASNDVNFMQQKLTEHKLAEDATLLVEKDSMLTKHQFDRVHDYRHNPNPAFKKLCKKVQDDKEQADGDEKPQSTAPGITMIVEAENLTTDLSSPSAVQSAIIDAIEGLGLTVVSDKLSDLDSPFFIIAMKEGYVVVRLWSEEKYGALDLHLWRSFDNHEGLKKAIVVDALGGDLMNKSTSSYRIVTGGMFGLPDWREESKKHGPQLDNLCTEDEGPIRDQASPLDVKMQALELSVDVLQGSSLTALVLCGSQSTDCSAMDVVKVGAKFDKVIPIYENEAGSAKTLDNYVEEAQILLDAELPGEADFIDAVFLDDGTTELSTYVFRMIMDDGHLDLENLFTFATTDKKSEIWRRQYLDLLKGEIEMDPVFRALLLVNTTSSSLEVSITASGDPLFMEHLSDVVSGSQEKSPAVTLETRNIVGGLWRGDKQHMCTDDEFSQVAVEDDYNHDDARSQWASQTPLATQTLLQFSSSMYGELVPVEKDDLIKACAGAFATQKGSSMKVYDDFGGDGAICAGAWETGTAVVSWDGRYGVDLNIFSTLDLEELQSFEKDIKTSLSSLIGWLRDIQPRGYGRVVSFKESMMPGASNFFSDDDDE
ncbi:unnamed protein product [Cylindrotheca closterium]|uniref:Uncharacterized protein n=1 Tax=Cylindrotheca closterium TaxID=2856 RepID=A0AAD2CHH2_9STRA|nr:unnamed protein product [Cylindrotheca closterium]